MSQCDDEALAAEYRTAYYATADDPRLAAWAAAHPRVWDAVVEQILTRQSSVANVLDVFLAFCRGRADRSPTTLARSIRRAPGGSRGFS